MRATAVVSFMRRSTLSVVSVVVSQALIAFMPAWAFSACFSDVALLAARCSTVGGRARSSPVLGATTLKS